jgi:hypothetical protein
MAGPFLLRPAATDIEWWIIKGETYDIHIPVLDDDDTLVDLTGYTAKAQVRRTEHEPVLHEWTSTGGTPNASTDATGVTLNVLAAQTSAWTWSDAQVSVEIYAPITGRPSVIAQGPIHALPEITR